MRLRYLLLTTLLLTNFSFSQEISKTSKEKITTSLVNYFKQDRENIHLHLNKNTYLTNETIWFKGYVIEKKECKLNYQTTNVLLKIYDEDKNEIKSHLFYTTNGTIIGQIKLNENYASGIYYLHVYTNYMNNFTENESSLTKFEIINTKDNVIVNENKNLNDLNIDYAVEGGKLLFNTDNTLVVNIKDCKGNGIKLNNIEVRDEAENIVSIFSTNELGYGKFEILKTKNENYKIVVLSENAKVEKKINPSSIEGINLKVNNFAIADKFSIKVITNSNTFEKVKNTPYIITIQKNNLVNYIDFKFDENTTKELIINKEALFKGINTIRLIDDKLDLISERIIYNPEIEKPKITILNQTKIRDSIKIKGKIENRVANLSISTLPKNSVSKDNFNSIIASLKFNNYLEQKIANTDYYFNDFNRRKQYELDLFLISNSPKTKWSSIVENKVNNNHPFDIGLDIEGKINQVLNNKEKLKLRLFSITGVNELTEINDKNEFKFNNILAVDSTNFHFSLLKNEDKIQNLNIYSVIKNNNRKFLKPIEFEKPKCNSKSYTLATNTSFDFPSHEKVLILDSIGLVGTKKEKMNFAKQYNNGMSKGYKISEEDYGSFRDVLSFIASHGYDVSTEAGNVTIRSRITRSVMGNRTPVVYLDNSPLFDFNLLSNLNLNEIDEIYINKNGFGMSNDGSNGSIRIYRKIGFTDSTANFKVKSKGLIVKNGFEKFISFKNPKYIEYRSEAFEKHGTLHWEPNIYTDENGNFEFTIPHYYQKEILLNIQGIDNNGDLYFETTTINN